MKVSRGVTASGTTVVLPVFKGKKSLPFPGAQLEDGGAAGGFTATVKRLLKSGAFAGDKGEGVPIFPPQAGKVGAVWLWGLGDREKFTAATLWRETATLARRLAKSRHRRVAMAVDSEALSSLVDTWGADVVGAELAAGWRYGGYTFDDYKTERPSKPTPEVALLTGRIGAPAARRLQDAARRGVSLGDAVNFSRDLSNTPANDLHPEALAAAARRVGRSHRLAVKVLGPAELKRLKMGCILGVAQGSRRPPRLIEMRYQPRRKARKTVVLVGKAITFDSGGICIKPAKGMEEMKFDMCGGATVIGALRAIADLAPATTRVVGLIPASENLTGAAAMRPGDILKSASGKTVEVINTDAEGRLVLADALHYAKRFRPDAVLDFATLTGAIVVALGSQITGVMSNSDDLAAQVLAAGDASGDRVWRMPLDEEFMETTRSQVADLRNSCGRDAGALTAGAFLAHFVDDMPWCHLDIAGTAWSDRDQSHAAAGATGVGVRLAVDLVRRLGR